MNNLYRGFVTKLFLIRFLHGLQDRRIDIGFPTRITSRTYHLHTSHGKATFQACIQIILHGITRATTQNLNFRFSTTNVHDSQIRRSFHRIGDGRNHSEHTILTSINGIYQVITDFSWNHHFRKFHSFCAKGNRSFVHLIFLIPQGFAILHKFQHISFFFGRNCNHHLTFAWNGITHVTSIPRHQASLIESNYLIHKTSHEFVGIGTAFVNFQTGMTATKSLQCYFQSHIFRVCFFFLVRQSSSQIFTTCTTNIKFAFVFRIQIEQDFTIYRTRFQSESTIHTCFLIRSDQCFKRAMYQGLVFHHRHNSSNSHTIVGS